MNDTEILDWICEHPSELGIKPEFTAHSREKLVCEWSDIRKIVIEKVSGNPNFNSVNDSKDVRATSKTVGD